MAGAGHVELPAAELSNLEELSKVSCVSQHHSRAAPAGEAVGWPNSSQMPGQAVA